MNAIGKSRIAELLVQQGLVTHQQVDEAVAALTHYKAGRKKLSRILLEKGFVTETALTDVLSTHLGIPQIAPDPSLIDSTVVI